MGPALSSNATQLGLKAAAVANSLGVGIEIDYEQNRNPNLTGLQQFITAYRSQISYDATGNNHAARLTIDLACGDRWLIDICRKQQPIGLIYLLLFWIMQMQWCLLVSQAHLQLLQTGRNI
jgi:hypothetical protein